MIEVRLSYSDDGRRYGVGKVFENFTSLGQNCINRFTELVDDLIDDLVYEQRINKLLSVMKADLRVGYETYQSIMY